MTDSIRVDLHCHSYLSDGDHSPEHVAQTLAASGVVWAALTDHNTLAGQERFRAAAEQRGVRVVSGLEMDACSPAGAVHLLAYGVDTRDRALLRTLQAVRRPLRSRAHYWIGRVRTLSGVPTPRTGSQADVAGSPHQPPDAADAIRLIHAAGGLAFLAHPLAGLEGVEPLEELLECLQPQGLDGLEVFHKPSPARDQDELLAIAERRGLLAVAGSDFHGVDHSFGADPGVDLRREHWDRFAGLLARGPQRIDRGGPGGEPASRERRAGHG
jgi:3',5'-nucleoside bisphosphate phosphatase